MANIGMYLGSLTINQTSTVWLKICRFVRLLADLDAVSG